MINQRNRRSEMLEDTLSPSGRDVAVFRPVVRALVRVMFDFRHNLLLRRAAGSQFIGDHACQFAFSVCRFVASKASPFRSALRQVAVPATASVIGRHQLTQGWIRRRARPSGCFYNSDFRQCWHRPDAKCQAIRLRFSLCPINAMRTGPIANSPALALSVSARR